MKTKLTIARGRSTLFLLLLSTLSYQPSTASAQGTAFTYQGQLQNNGALASGTYNLQFALYTNSTGGTAVAGPVTNSAVPVTNGLFTVTIDFGADVWNGETNWLQIGVETNGGSAFTTLSPRQQVTPTPYAIFAEGANAAGITGTLPAGDFSGTYGAAVNLTNAGNSFSGNGSGLTNVNAATVGGLAAANFWQTTGNAGTSPTNGNFLGTTDNQPLELRVGGLRGWRVEPDPRGDGAANLIGGYVGNAVQQPGSGGDFIGGGGYVGGLNTIYSNSSGVFIGAGSANQIGPNLNDAVIAGGYGNIISGDGFRSVIGGGLDNTNEEAYSVIGGGVGNIVEANADHSVIGGGQQNVIQGDTLGGTYDSTIAGGQQNTIGTNAYNSFIGGGYVNTISVGAQFSTIGGGLYNQIYGDTNSYGTSVIVGGFVGTIYSNSWNSFIGGGGNNTIGTNSDHSVIVGGDSNAVLVAQYGTIGGGFQNTVGAYSATVPGGTENFAGGAASFAAGQHAQATNNGAFVWSDDSTTNPFSSTGTNQFLIRASGGVGINTNNPAGVALNVAGTVQATSFQGNGSGLSDLAPLGNYVFAYSMALQTVSTPSTFQDATFNNDAQLNGWTHTPGSSQYNCAQTGLYLVQYTTEAQINDSMSMRGALNEIEIPGSQSYASPNNSGPTVVISKSFLASVNSGSFLTIQFTGNSGSDHLQGGGSGTVQPSLSLTITRIQ